MSPQAALEQLKTAWTSLSRWQRMSIPVVAAAVVAALVAFAQWRTDNDFKPLITGMNPEDAGAIVAKLKENGTEYRLGDNGATVLVPSARVAETRLQIASAGLPKSGRIGFELFDKTSLGTTDFAEQVNYRRALEGELERSIRSISEVEQARVHLTFPKDSVFIESRLPAKASVLVHLRPNAHMTHANITAISQLVASAVEGLAAEDVSIMDDRGNLLSRPKRTPEIDGASDELIEYRQKIEKDLLAKASSTLEPLVGPGRFRIGLSVECDFASGEESEETYDPEKSVMTNSQKSEETNTINGAGGIPGTSSNLPRSTGRTASTATTVTRRTENVAYQSSRMIRRMKLPQGNIRRISASVLLDQNLRWENVDGRIQRVLEPPSAENMRAIRELVAAAVGIIPNRGDQLVVESLPFDNTLQTPPPHVPQTAPQPASEAPGNPLALPSDWRIYAAIGGGLVVIAALFLLVRKRLRRRRKGISATAAPALPQAVVRDELGAAPEEHLLPSGEQATKLLAQAQERVTQTARIESLVSELRNSIGEDPELAASVLRAWLEEVDA